MNPRTKALVKKMRGGWSGSKSEALQTYKAHKSKKKLPVFDREYKEPKSEYKKLSIEEYEKKYLK